MGNANFELSKGSGEGGHLLRQKDFQMTLDYNAIAIILAIYNSNYTLIGMGS